MVTNNKHTAPKEDDAISTIMVLPVDNALNPAHDREIDLRQIDEEDMKLLQQNGEYLFYLRRTVHGPESYFVEHVSPYLH